ncbi:hypothetical protein CBR_g54163 [Chara braunii]|uniref:Uncharacterized protein n=1 Tax=Chara braunii TaxID=69332 RepID=A0A388K762_CHABU|nr:hypothetical protein CBR_g54163 [Chara braunii]|eukprot:GBG65871.1 hypothetical protein CBR_g54163 [Chara braunii]
METEGREPSQLQKECQSHWLDELRAAGHPASCTIVLSSAQSARAVFTMALSCLRKILAYEEISLPTNIELLKDLLSEFHVEDGDKLLGSVDILPRPRTGSLEHNFLEMYWFLDNFVEAAMQHDLSGAIELVLSLEELVRCAESYERNYNSSGSADGQGSWNGSAPGSIGRRSSFSVSVTQHSLVTYLRKKLSNSAKSLLGHDWDLQDPGRSWRGKVRIVFSCTLVDLLLTGRVAHGPFSFPIPTESQDV